jgi:hypothetical protein
VPAPVSGDRVAPESSTRDWVSFGPNEFTPAFTIEPRKNISPA